MIFDISTSSTRLLGHDDILLAMRLCLHSQHSNLTLQLWAQCDKAQLSRQHVTNLVDLAGRNLATCLDLTRHLSTQASLLLAHVLPS